MELIIFYPLLCKRIPFNCHKLLESYGEQIIVIH
jgi:hypothetical protein